MINCDHSIPSHAADLIETIRSLDFGEMFGVDVDMSTPLCVMSLTVKERSLIDLLENRSYIDVLTVHQGEPWLAEQDQKISGFSCRKKTKFPTE